MQKPQDHTLRLQTLKTMGARWYKFFEKQLWSWEAILDGQPCLVYGTGNSSWGAWAQINAALFAASTSRWDDTFFAQSPKAFRTCEQRRDAALSLIRYALGYHSTGEFNGASNNRWGGVLQPPAEQELYENWHSPLWTCLLAQAVFALGDDVPADIHRRLTAAVAHDAMVQTGLGLQNFDGSAQEEVGKKSHPESNAWKAALLTLARGLCVDHPQKDAWQQREMRLWASSFAIPGDEQNEEMIQSHSGSHSTSYRVKDLVIGNHLTPSYTVIHHRFIHPCYYIFSLLPRTMAATYAGRLGIDYPHAAARHEAKVFARLLELTMHGRVIYPAGQDWPRWVYGQAYLLPMLAHRMVADGVDYTSLIDSLIATRLQDANVCSGQSMILHRFGNLLHDHPWTAHRYETDMIASLVWTVDLLSEAPAVPGREAQATEKFDMRCHEPLGQTVYERRDDGFFAMSTRAHAGPLQLTALPVNNPDLLEWRSNGSMTAKLRGAAMPEYVEQGQSRLQLMEPQGFCGRTELHFGGGPSLNLNPALYTGRVVALAMKDRPIMLVHQQLISNSHGYVDRINLHVWRIAQSIHNHCHRVITSEDVSHDVETDQEIELSINSPWVCVDGSLCLSLLPLDVPASGSSFNAQMATPLKWRLRQTAQGHQATRLPTSGAAWLELSLQIDQASAARTRMNELLTSCGLAVSLDGKPVTGRCTTTADAVDFHLDGMSHAVSIKD